MHACSIIPRRGTHPHSLDSSIPLPLPQPPCETVKPAESSLEIAFSTPLDAVILSEARSGPRRR